MDARDARPSSAFIVQRDQELRCHQPRLAGLLGSGLGSAAGLGAGSAATVATTGGSAVSAGEGMLPPPGGSTVAVTSEGSSPSTPNLLSASLGFVPLSLLSSAREAGQPPLWGVSLVLFTSGARAARLSSAAAGLSSTVARGWRRLGAAAIGAV